VRGGMPIFDTKPCASPLLWTLQQEEEGKQVYLLGKYCIIHTSWE